jgi:hypothetical protein
MLSPEGCEIIMTDKFIGIDIEITENGGVETAFAGLIPLLQMSSALKLPDVINQSLHVRSQKGFKDHEYIMSLAAMQLVEGSTLDHLAIFKEKFALNALPFNIPSPSAGRGYLGNFHNVAEESKQKQGRAYIPEENEHLAGFRNIHAFCFRQAFNMKPLSSITLDQDATFIYTNTKNALRNYEGEKSYEAFNTYCPEYDMVEVPSLEMVMCLLVMASLKNWNECCRIYRLELRKSACVATAPDIRRTYLSIAAKEKTNASE